MGAQRGCSRADVAIALYDNDLTASAIVTEPSHASASSPPLASASAPSAPSPPPPPPSPVTFPITWILDNAAPPIRYRALRDVARPSQELIDNAQVLAYSYGPALLLAVQQAPDGTWNRSMLGVPPEKSSNFEGVGTINAARRLLEYGWDRDSPPLIQARRILFRLLAEDDDPAYLFELAPKGTKVDPETAQRGRMVMREAAAATLAQAGYEGDPRLRGAAKRITERVAEFVRSPLGERPFVRVGNQHVIAAEATPPSLFLLQMLAHMPLFRSEHYQLLDVIYEYIARPLPRQTAVQLFGKKILPQPQLVLGDMLSSRNVADTDVPWALHWLELMARLGYLRRNEGWCRLFDRFLDDRDSSGVWHPHKGTAVARSANPYVWPSYPLEEEQAGEDRWTDATFRLGLIARLSGRPIELV